MRFCLFSKRFFEVEDPIALIEAYCFQSNFYESYDFPLMKGQRSFGAVGFIGARIKKSALDKCKEIIINLYKDNPIFSLNLCSFLKLKDEEKSDYVRTLDKLASDLDKVNGVGFSKATKILHTLYPEIIPIIDNALQKEYQKLNPLWKQGNWNQIFMDYYDNFLVSKDTYKNLCDLHSKLSLLGLTKVRIFDILWWSYLKAKKLNQQKNIEWSTIKW